MTRDGIMQAIRPNMRLTKAFFVDIYTEELTYPGFAEQALKALEAAGCTRARQYYADSVREHEAPYEAELKEVASWYAKECEKHWKELRKEGEKQRNGRRRELLEHKRRLMQSLKTSTAS